MHKRWIVLVIMLGLAAGLRAQLVTVEEQEEETEEMLPIVAALDSLAHELFCSVSSYNIMDSTAANRYGFSADSVPDYPDSVYRQRLRLLPAVVPLTYNQYVYNFIHLYTFDRRDQVKRMLGLTKVYYPIIESVLDRHNLPLELKHLAVVESALNPHAVSSRGATGMWQFMYGTARMYDLEINSYVDDRRDPYLATEAAARYFEQWYAVYGDWLLVIAAYNCGPGNVNRAIRRAGGVKNFWVIRPYLPRETRGYVPAFIAATYVMNYYEEHNLYSCAPLYDFLATDTVNVMGPTSFERIGKFTGVSPVELAFYNPSYRREFLPYSDKAYTLRVPMNKVVLFEQFRDSLPMKEVPVEYTAATVPATTAVSHTHSTSIPVGTAKVVYTVKAGDNLGYIAEWYNVTAQNLRDWNHIYGNSIYVGQNLAVYVPVSRQSYYARVNSMSFSEKQKMAAGGGPAATTSGGGTTAAKGMKTISYTVKDGDTLWDISRRYPGLTVERIKQLNNITDSHQLKPGMVLKLEVAG